MNIFQRFWIWWNAMDLVPMEKNRVVPIFVGRTIIKFFRRMSFICIAIVAIIIVLSLVL